MLDGDTVKFVHISATDYDELSDYDPATVYFITSSVEKRVAIGDTPYANYIPAHCTAISLSTTSESIGVGEFFTLIATTQPADPSDAIVFTASNQNVSITTTAVSNRVVITGVSIGTCTITCTCGECSATCAVTVHPEYVYVEHILVENYNPNGAKFKYTIPSISLDAGDYIEISIDLSTITGTKENIISLRQSIDTWSGANTGPRIHNYVTATAKQTISVDLLKDTKQLRPTYSCPSTDYLIVVNKRGVYLNGTLFTFDTAPFRATPTLTYEEGIAALLALTTFDIGSQEGSNRSHATYNYIKYFTVEEVTP